MAEDVRSRLQRALESASFETANPLIAEYGIEVTRQLRAAQTDEERTEIAGHTLSFLQDHLNLTRAMRSQIADQIARLSRLARYHRADEAGNTWQLHG